MFKEFREFILRGNVLDLAVGIIMGTAFTAIVNSLVNDIIMPPIGLALGGVDFSNLFVQLSGREMLYTVLAEAQKAGVATLNYGVFINALVKFIIIAFAVFLLVKAANRLMAAKKEEAPAAPAPTPEDIVLLREIRDSLRR